MPPSSPLEPHPFSTRSQKWRPAVLSGVTRQGLAPFQPTCRFLFCALQVLQYQAGYIACAAIAVVYFVAVPLAGLSICCCRRRRRCGGRLKAYRRSLLCRCHVLMACLFLTTLVILPLKGVQQTVQQFAVPKEQVLSDLNSESPVSTVSHLAFSSVCHRISQEWATFLTLWATSGVTLMQRQAELEAALRARKPSITALLGDPRCTYCASAASRAQGLEPEANFRKVSSSRTWVLKLPGLHARVQTRSCSPCWGYVLRDLTAGPRRYLPCNDCLPALKEEVENAAQKVQSIADSFPVTDHTRPLAEALAKAENGSRPYLKEVAHYERCRWIAAVIACTVLLLIVCCNLLGLVCGAYGLAVRDDPSDYDGRGEAGAKLLITGVCFSFLFSWLLMLLVFGTFITGGNVRTVLCKPWASQEVYQFIDTPGNLPPSMNISWRLGLKEDLNVTTAYQQCKNGAGLWEVLQLEGSYSLNEHLKVEKVSGREQCWGLARYGDFCCISPQLHKSVVRTNMDGLALDLERLSNLQVGGRIGSSLLPWAPREESAAAASSLHSHPCFPANLAYGCSLQSVTWCGNSAPCRLCPFPPVAWLAFPGAAGLSRKAPACLTEVLPHSAKITRLRGSFSPLLQLAEDVASCQPVSTALDSARVILCDRIVDPWNAFWFSLGSCTFFLIPSIFFSIKTVQHFRPVRHRLISTGSEETCPFHIPRVTSLRL
uniref:Prominin 2 n=1 Tax=Varanus komodoensis TaxID=61221 RepID=A0A8D2LGK9_VARKO